MNDAETGTTVAPEAAERLRAYLLVREDLPSLGRGKALAHAMHAGNHMTHRLEVLPLLAGERPDPRMTAWRDQGGGFGTTVALADDGRLDLATIAGVVAAAERLGHLAGTVVDPTYPYVVDHEVAGLIDPSRHTAPPKLIPAGWLLCRRETTCAWIMGDADELRVVLGRYGLAPND